LHRLFGPRAHWNALALVNESYGAIDAEFQIGVRQSVFQAPSEPTSEWRGREQGFRKDPGEGACQSGNGYGCVHVLTLALAMRYVIVICAITFFLIWDGLYNQGRYLDSTVREVSRVVRYVTGKV
jgi:hypothetical protein